MQRITQYASEIVIWSANTNSNCMHAGECNDACTCININKANLDSDQRTQPATL